jgi:glutamate 5-kinase
MKSKADQSARATPPERKQLLSDVRRVVVKVGTNVLTRENGELAVGRTHSLIEDIVDLHRRDLQVIVVSSGAISMGMDRLKLTQKPSDLPALQACAAIGQIRLMSVYEQAFRSFDINAAQVLLTEDDFADRRRYLNLRNTLNRLLEDGVVPIVNENDTVSTSEIEARPEADERTDGNVFGDNDRLSALVMSKLAAGLLVLLSDVDGLYGDYDAIGDRAGASETRPLSCVERLTPEIEALARDSSGRGRGGMISKLQSIKIALQAGGLAVIANGMTPGLLPRVLAGEDIGTLFLPERRLTSRKRWLAHASSPAGRVLVNTGARDALVERSSSLLFAGVTAIEGEFDRGDVVVIASACGGEIGRGKVNYGTTEARLFIGKHSTAIASATGRGEEEFIHRDNMVILV